MITISSKANLITLINVFTVEPANQRRLVELLTEATESSVGQAPGSPTAPLRSKAGSASDVMGGGQFWTPIPPIRGSKLHAE
jgi:hypothetical protein